MTTPLNLVRPGRGYRRTEESDPGPFYTFEKLHLVCLCGRDVTRRESEGNRGPL